MSDVDDLYAELVRLTGMSADDWRDFLELPEAAQQVAAQAYRGASWRTDPDTWAAVLALLEAAGAVAGAVTGIAGAAQALRAL